MPWEIATSSIVLHPRVDVIIPTYNRRESLLETLASLSMQTYPSDRFQVVVVDDGGNDGTDDVMQFSFPFKLLYCRQNNRGSAAARNSGVCQCSGAILVFIDDDVTLHAGYLQALVDKTRHGVISMGVWQPYQSLSSTFSEIRARQTEALEASVRSDHEVSFAECSSNNLAMCRSDFGHFGMWRDVLGDGPTLWGDVEFGYRAWKTGCRFLRVADARLVHRDHHVTHLDLATKRAYHVSNVVQPLFALHPEIKNHLPMFFDMDPIRWSDDSPRLIARKLIRQLVSSSVSLHTMEGLVCMLESYYRSPVILSRLYRWICSAYVYHGYRDGLRLN